jgi:hypothetical protein
MWQALVLVHFRSGLLQRQVQFQALPQALPQMLPPLRPLKGRLLPLGLQLPARLLRPPCCPGSHHLTVPTRVPLGRRR